MLDRIVASGNAGVDRRDTHDWILSRLIELRYVEESPLDSTAFVSTPVGRHRWQIEMLSDEQRAASAMRRQLIRYRVDERISNMTMNASTALAITYPPMTPRLYGGVEPSRPRRLTTRLKPALAALFTVSAVALVVYLGDTEPQDVRQWLSPPSPMHVDVAPPANVEAVPPTAPTDRDTVELASAVIAADAAPAFDDIVAKAEQAATVLDRTLAEVEAAAPDGTAIAGTVAHYDEAIRSAVVAAAALIDATISKTNQFAADLATDVKGSIRPIAAALLQSAVATETPPPAQIAAAPQPPADVPAPVALAPAPQPEPPPVTLQPRALPVAMARSMNDRVVAKAPTPSSEAQADPQHTVVERLNALSLAAAIRGEVWRPNATRNVAEFRPAHIR